MSMKKPAISIVVPVHNQKISLIRTLDSLKGQQFKDSEVIVVDDCSTDGSYDEAKKYDVRILANETRKGPAYARNKGIREADGEIVAFIDSDCIASSDWTASIMRNFKNINADAVMGRTNVKKSNIMGDSIAELGFPGGANAGFENIWRLGKDNTTDHITSCNFAARKRIFFEYGMFDEDFPLPGGEDPELSFRWSKKGVKIVYCPDILVFHEPTTNLRRFVKWQFVRGRSNYHFKKKVGKTHKFISLRLWSTKNILKKNISRPKIPIIFTLLFLSFLFQQSGYISEWGKQNISVNKNK